MLGAAFRVNNRAQTLASVKSGGESANLIMQMMMGKSEKRYKGEAQEAVGFDVKHLIQFEDCGKISRGGYT